MLHSAHSFAEKTFIVFLVLFFMGDVPVKGQVLEEYSALEDHIHQRIKESVASNAIWSVSVRDATGNEVITKNNNSLMRLASNSKLFVSAVLLDKLGADFRFKTSFYTDGALTDSLWTGNFYFKGSGDPSLDGLFYNDNPLYVFDQFLDPLLEKGIRVIHGDLFGNEALFDDIRYPRGWEWDDLSYYYAPEISALSFNRNCVDLTVRATGRPGDRPSISWFPFNTDYVRFVNEQVITPASVRYDESYSRVLGTNTILLRSTLPVGYLETESLSVTEPAYYFIDTFKKYAETRGIEWMGDLIVEKNERDWDQLSEVTTHASLPLSVLIKRLNAESDNFYTEMLLKALAAYSLQVTGTTEAGLTILMDWLIEHGFSENVVQFRDGSGMASANLTTTSVITDLLTQLQSKSYADIYMDSFATPGNEGTLKNRLLSSPLMGNLHAKTGFISGVRSLSGYLDTVSGNTYTFSIITNNFTSRVRTVDIVHENILELLYESL